MKGDDFKDRFAQTEPAVIELLLSLLEFNPQYRLSAKECLRHPIFDDIRVERLEQGAPYEIFLVCDGMD